MITAQEGKIAVQAAYASALAQITAKNLESPLMTATAICAGILHQVKALAHICEPGAFAEIDQERKFQQAALLEAFK